MPLSELKSNDRSKPPQSSKNTRTKPRISQRELVNELDVNRRKVNYCVKALMDKGKEKRLYWFSADEFSVTEN
ncbi:MAG: winged helix-turn-helix transcriptional regulator [Pseudomonadales bacterium]|nr:winged helix-turn-helix transcriptional regulator [Pseudomonadales bacterium]